MKANLRRLCAVAMCLTLVCGAALAQENTEESEKRERVFAVLNQKGEAETIIDSVLVTNPQELDTLTDASQLDGIENSRDERGFTRDGDAVLWDAQGKEIAYQGTGNKALPVRVTLTCTVDGAESASYTDLTGHVEIKAAYTSDSEIPHLCLTALLLSEDECGNIAVENGFAVSDGSHTVAVGFGVTGCAEAEEYVSLPASMTVSFDAAGYDCADVYTVVTSEPLSMLTQSADGYYGTADALVTELTDDLTAWRDGGSLTKSDSQIYTIMSKLETLFAGADKLHTGAASLAKSLGELSGSSAALNEGASQMVDALFASATAQLQALSPDAKALTRDNYADTLDAMIAATGSEALSTLKQQLSSCVTFEQSLKEYTAGVASAQMGAGLINVGAGQLATGLSTAKESAVSQLLPLLTGDVRGALDAYASASAKLSKTESYDLIPEGMGHSLLFICRSAWR